MFSGVYRDGDSNELRVAAIDDKTLDVHYCGTHATAAGGINMGDARGQATLGGNVATFRPPDTGSCTITIAFERGTAKVTQKGSSGQCALGHGVDATGIYAKVQAGNPDMLEEFFCVSGR